jgi:hypothetical protein
LKERAAWVRGGNVDSGVSQQLHDLFWRRIGEIEDDADGAEVTLVDCSAL